MWKVLLNMVNLIFSLSRDKECVHALEKHTEHEHKMLHVLFVGCGKHGDNHQWFNHSQRNHSLRNW